MERPTFIEACNSRIGQEWRPEDQIALVAHIAEIEKTYQELIRRKAVELREKILGVLEP